MRLKVLLPSQILIDENTDKITGRGREGAFGLLPKHIDIAIALVPGIMSYADGNGSEQFVAVDEGILIKQGKRVIVSTRSAITGENLGRLREAIEEQFLKLDESERESRSAIASLESNMIKRFAEQMR